MLVLSRHVSETIVITAPDGTRITLQVVEIRGDRCRLGVTASKDYAVHRGEIQATIDAKQRLADNETEPELGKDTHERNHLRRHMRGER